MKNLKVVCFSVVMLAVVLIFRGCHEKASNTLSQKPVYNIGYWESDLSQAYEVVGIHSPELLAKRLKLSGASFFIIKVVDNQGQLIENHLDDLPKIITACQKYGIRVYLYARYFKAYFNPAIASSLRVVNFPETAGFIVDVEEALPRGGEGTLCAIKEEAPRKIFGVSTLGRKSLHPEIDYQKLAECADIVMPQLYISKIPRFKNETIEERYSEAMADWGFVQNKLIPVIQAYRDGIPGVKRIPKNYLSKELRLNREMGLKGICLFRFGLTGAEQRHVATAFAYPSKAKVSSAKGHRPKIVKVQVPGVFTKKFKRTPGVLLPHRKGRLSGLAVMVDAGHGGSDPGCSYTETFKGRLTPRKFCEASLTYKAAWELGEMLRFDGATIGYTAYSNYMVEPQKKAQELLPRPRNARFCFVGGGVSRPDIVRRNLAARAFIKKAHPRHVIFISLHMDSEGDKDLHGAHVCAPKGYTPVLAKFVAKRLKAARYAGWFVPSKYPDGIVPRGNLAILRTHSLHPERLNPIRERILIEMATPGNSGRDSWRLRSPKSRKKLLNAIVRGVEDYYGELNIF